MKLYKEGDILEEDEFLLKLEYIEGKDLRRPRKGFLSKLTQKGEIPKSMIKWGNGREVLDKTKPYDWSNSKIVYSEIYIHKEKEKPGWKIYDYRTGQSQDWVVLEHPNDFLVEIYMKNFFEILKKEVIIDGRLSKDYSWKDYKLI